MATRDVAQQDIDTFLEGTAGQVLLLTGTNIGRKHPLALAAVLHHSATVLFRTSSAANIGSFLSSLSLQKPPKSGRPVPARGAVLHADTFNRRSWGFTPSTIDTAVVYPIDALGERDGERCVRDLLNRGARVLLVSWLDNVDFSWIDQFDPVRVTYDVLAENAAQHESVVESVGAQPTYPGPRNLPKYAQRVPWCRLVRVLCRGKCGATRWAELNADYPGAKPLKDAEMGQYKATCLRCEKVALDNYNWGHD